MNNCGPPAAARFGIINQPGMQSFGLKFLIYRQGVKRDWCGILRTVLKEPNEY